MRKNLMADKRLADLSKEEVLERFNEVYGIDPTVVSVDGTQWEKLHHAAQLLVTHAKLRGMQQHEALAQITSANLAALVFPWNDPNGDTRKVGRTLSKYYTCRGSGATAISQLRAEFLEGERQLNMYHPQRNGQGIPFSYRDQSEGIKLPSELGPEEFFLFGVYRADGNPVRPKKFIFQLTGKTGDESFYETMLVPLVDKLFNFKSRAIVTPRKTAKYTWNDVHISLISQAHFHYLQDHILLFDESRRFLPLSPHLANGNAAACSLAYVMGMLAGAGHMAQRDGCALLQVHDGEEKVVPELQRHMQNGYAFPHYQAKHRAGYIHFTRATIAAMAEHPAPLLFPNQRGLFVNPRHLKSLDELL